MERKKSPKADLENKKGIFFELGLIMALGILLFAFEYKNSTAAVDQFEMLADEEVEEEIIPITQQQLTPPPPPPPPPPVLSELIEIVEDDVDIDDDLEILDAEDESENEVQDISEFDNFGEEDTGEAEVFLIVENMPVFPDGNVQAWIAKNIKYPVIAAENGIQGRVFIKFVIEKDGKVGNIEILRGVDASLDKEAVRVIKAMPAWKPGQQRGKAVRVSMQVPINFQLSN